MSYVKFRATRNNKVCGYTVVRCINDGLDKPIGLITYIIVKPEDRDAINALFSVALKYFEEKQCSAVRCYASHRGIQKALMVCGFIRHKVKMRFLINKNIAGLKDVEKLDNWHLTTGDCDTDR